MFDAGTANPSQLAEKVGLTRGAVSKLVEWLSRKKLAAVSSADDDRRYQKVELTSAGQRLVPVLAQLADDKDREFFGHLKPEERTWLMSLLQDIVRRQGCKDLPDDRISIHASRRRILNSEQIQVIQVCAQGAVTGEIAFPDIVGGLAQIGVERYHADYSRLEITTYLADGESLVVASEHPTYVAAIEFSASGVETAVRESQRNEHTYLDFIRKTMAAVCVGYFVQINGRRVIYFGRNGERHVEQFPTVQTNPNSE